MLERIRSPLGNFILVKARELILAISALVLLTFFLVQLVPGDPARIAAGVEASTEDVEVARKRLGLDQPLLVQLFRYVIGLFTGDLGTSFRTGEAVSEIIGVRFPYTLSLALFAITVALIFAISLGLAVAGLTRGNRNRWLDVGFSWVTATVQTIPIYVVGAILVLIFAVSLMLLPAGGAASPASFVLPVAALSFAPACSIARVVRREAASVLEQDYMRTARGWRIPLFAQYAKYALPNLLASTLTLSGLILGSMLGGSIIIERVFAWPGLGNGIIEAILERDYPVIRGIIFVVGSMAVLLNILIDFVLASLDPRILRSGKALV